MGKGTSHIVILAATGFDELLKLRYDQIPASLAAIVNSVTVVDFFSAVETQNNIAHLSVREVYNILHGSYNAQMGGATELSGSNKYSEDSRNFDLSDDTGGEYK